MKHKGRWLEGKHLMDKEDMLLSSIRVLSQGVLNGAFVYSDSAPAWVLVSFAEM